MTIDWPGAQSTSASTGKQERNCCGEQFVQEELSWGGGIVAEPTTLWFYSNH